MEKEVKVPDIGDFEDVEVVEVLVEVGAEVALEDPILTLETDKAAMDIPAPFAGVVKQLMVNAGDRVSEGDTVALVVTQDESSASASADEPPADTPSVPEGGEAEELIVEVPDIGDFDDVEVIEVLVSQGDIVAKDDPLITLESDKAAMDVPAPSAGTIVDVLIQTGDRVSKGSHILKLLGPGAEAAAAPAESTPAPQPAESVTEEVRVPDIGDFDGVEVIEVHVSQGDQLKKDDPLITLESDKAAMDVPAPNGGTVISVDVKQGDKVSEGDLILALKSTAGPEKQSEPTPAPKAQAPTPEPAKPAAPRAPSAPRQLPPINENTFSQAHASPSVRRFARELGVDLNQINGTGHKQRILLDDVKGFVKSIMTGAGPAPAGSALPELPKIDFTKFGETDPQPLTRIQKISGPRLHAAWVNIPHVTQFDEADVTDLEAYRKANKEAVAAQGAKLTLLAFIIKACYLTLQEYPRFNSSLDSDNDQLIYKKYFNVGFAADTPNGLVVPVIKDVDKKSVVEIAQGLGDLSAKARDGKLKAGDMQGACFTISSLGGIGGTLFTPIINPPEVAILGLSRSFMKPVYDGSEFKPRLMLPLSLSYDHRVIDGAMAARFTTFLAQVIKEMRDLTL